MNLKAWLSSYSFGYPSALVYMLQASEYNIGDYLEWLRRVRNFRTVQQRKQLNLTAKAKLLRLVIWLAIVLIIVVLVGLYFTISLSSWLLVVLVAFLVLPYILAYGIIIPLSLGTLFVQKPKERRAVGAAKTKLSLHNGIRIAVAGSYGKTTMRYILADVLSSSKRVATPEKNYNVPLSISNFINKLGHDEEVLVFELGEYYPGDVAELSELVQPAIGVITGVNEAHLAKFKSIDRTTKAIFELADYLKDKPLYVNGDDKRVHDAAKQYSTIQYSHSGCHDWRITQTKTDMNGTSFVAKKGSKKVVAKSKLLGLHQIGPLTCAIALADELGLSSAQIETGLARTKPFEHRMEPYQIGDAWVIDDTYNGNLDGVRVGLEFLGHLKARRKIYITPGLVEQGDAVATVHRAMGEEIAKAKPELVVLMHNSTTGYIQHGLDKAGFKGELRIEQNPAYFYANLDNFVAAGDVVLMQNDWADNYN